MIKYIYVIKRKDNFKIIYVGSTTRTISQRKAKHKYSYNNGSKFKVYDYMRNNGGFDEFFFELYEKFEGTNDELHKREGQIIIDLKRNQDGEIYNTYIAGRNKEEYYKEWKENNKDYYKEWKENNKDYYKEWKENNKDYYKEYYKNNKNYFKEYYKNKKTTNDIGFNSKDGYLEELIDNTQDELINIPDETKYSFIE